MHAHARLQDTHNARLGLIWLERSETIIQGVRFVGTTLWSDFDALAPSVGADPSGAGTLKARETAFRAANFYLHKAPSPAMANPGWPRRCANKPWRARPGCAMRLFPASMTDPRWS